MRTFEQTRFGSALDEARPPAGRRRRSTWWVTVVIAAVVATIAAGATYAWQRSELRHQQAATSRALRERDAARGEVGALAARVEDLQAQLADATTGREAIRRQLRRARADVLALTGPPLADGRYFGAVKALGADQAPARLVFDVAHWFYGDAADKAAIEDGNMPPGETHVPNDFYIRNVDPRWRILMVDPGTRVSLTTNPFGSTEEPKVVSLDRFATLFGSRDTSLRWFPYWITVRDDTVVRIEEQYIP